MVREDLEGADTGVERTRVLMIEDHGMVAEALGGVIATQPDLELVHVAQTIADGLDAAARLQPDLVVADLHLTDGVVTTAIAELLRRSPDSRVLIVTGGPTEKALLDALEAGALGFVVKAQPIEDYLDALRRVASGELVVASELAGVVLNRLGRGRSAGPSSDLSRRELEVVELLAAGMTTAGIAERLHLSPNTVRNHITNLTAKLDVHSRLEAVAEATRRGLITAPHGP